MTAATKTARYGLQKIGDTRALQPDDYDFVLDTCDTEMGPAVVRQEASVSYTLAATDAGKFIQFTDGSGVTLTIPAAATVDFEIDTEISGEQNGAGTVTVAAAVGVTLTSSGSKVATAAQHSVFTLKKVAANTWILFGDLA